LRRLNWKSSRLAKDFQLVSRFFPVEEELVMNKKTLIAGLLVSSLASSIAIAHPEFESDAERAEFKEKMRHGMHHRKEGRKDLFRAAFKKLDLTDEQKEQLKTIKSANKETFKAKRKDIMELKKQVRELTEAEQIDEGAIKALSLQIAELKAEQVIKGAQLKQEMMKVLTDEQRAKLSEMKEKRMAKRKARFERMKERFEEE